jgi:phage terminase small subunit
VSAEKLTPKQLAFVRAHIRLGGLNATQAAIAAGYSGKGNGAGAAVTACRLLNKPHILDALRKETERSLRGGVAIGAAVLEDLAKSAKSEAVRFQAAQALLDRGGMQLTSVSEQRIVVEDRRSDLELLERVTELQRELGLSTKVIDAHPLIPAQHGTPYTTDPNVSDAVLVGDPNAE